MDLDLPPALPFLINTSPGGYGGKKSIFSQSLFLLAFFEFSLKVKFLSQCAVYGLNVFLEMIGCTHGLMKKGFFMLFLTISICMSNEKQTYHYLWFLSVYNRVQSQSANIYLILVQVSCHKHSELMFS